MDSAVRDEVDALEHQRARIEDILADRIVSPEMARDLRKRLEFITHRMSQLSADPTAHPGQQEIFGAPGNF